MKKIVLGLIVIGFCSCHTKTEKEPREGFTINGSLAGIDSAWIVLQKLDKTEWVKLDSTQSSSFTFTGQVDLPEMFFIKAGDKGRIRVFVENSTIHIEGHADSLKTVNITGSKMQSIYKDYKRKVAEYNQKMRDLYPEYDRADSLGDEKRKADLDSIYNHLYEEETKYIKSVIAENTDNPIGPYVTASMYYKDDKLEELDSIYHQFDSRIHHSIYAKRIKETIDTWKKVAIGQPAINFTQQDTSKVPLSLNDFKGQYVLIDFWASWCGPCRQENPNVVAMYHDLHDKGFEIIGVSFDTNEKKWKKAIQDDELTWYHVSDLKGWKNEVGQAYGVQAIPHTVLIDKTGEIIAKNLRGKELREKLEELLL